jgi:hypothetical protein
MMKLPLRRGKECRGERMPRGDQGENRTTIRMRMEPGIG